LLRPLLVATLALLALHNGAAQAPARPELRVLFVGNSLTYSNDLPAIVEDLARADGAASVQTAAVVFGNFSLADHLARGDAARRIAEGHWDFVVLQQGPSALPESRTELIASTRAFAALCAPVGAKLALFGVWPDSERLSAFDSVTASYGAAAKSVGGLLLPAGRAWQLAWQRDPSLPLYGGDGFHPGPFGSYLAALVIYEGLTGRSPAQLPDPVHIGGAQVTIPPGSAAIMQAAAKEALR
jgi:hypothetical protein